MNATIERVVGEILETGRSRVDDPLEEGARYVFHRSGEFAWASENHPEAKWICVAWRTSWDNITRRGATENVSGVVAAICAGIPVKRLRNGDSINSRYPLGDHLTPWPTSTDEPPDPAQVVETLDPAQVFVIPEGHVGLDSFTSPEAVNPMRGWAVFAEPLSGNLVLRDGVATLTLSDGRELSFMLTRIDFGLT